jgi:2-iminobutanoate/2-iminopropanoate deaminase
MKEIIFSEKAPKPIGPYSQAIAVANFIFLSGQIGIDPNSGNIVAGGVTAETRQVMANIRAVLEKVNLTLANIIKTTIFLANLADFTEVNQIYAEYFTKDFPARSTVEVKALPKGAKIEIEVIAQK